MEQTVRDAFDAVRTFKGKTFRAGCYAPFVSLYFTSLGNVLACCKNESYILGNVSKDRLKDIWNGGKTQKLRQALSNYRYEAGCEFCEWQISEGNYRGAFPWLFENFEVGSSTPEWPQMIEFAGSNTCNFECIMCNGELSSSIRAHKDGLPPLPRFYSDQFFDDLREFLPHLKRAKFLGGEPFLASETLRIWDMIIEEKLRIPCHVTTNGSQYNAKVERILEYLPISLTLSIDGRSKETYEKVRLNSNYDETFRNLYRFRKYTRKKKTYFSIAFCLMRQNWHEFIDMLLFAEELECDLFVNTVIGPSNCSLFTLPADEMLHIANEIEKRGQKVEKKFRRNHHVWKDNIIKLRGKSSEGQAEHVRKIIDTHYNRQDPLTAAWNLANVGRKKEALEEARKVQKGDPAFYRAVAFCGRLQRDLGEWEAAEVDLQRAIKMSAKRPEAFIYLAQLRLDQNRPQEALDSALQAHKLVKEEDLLEVETCSILAPIYIELGNFAEALKVLMRLEHLQPKNHEISFQRAKIFRLTGMPERALEELEKALAIDPDHPEANHLKRELQTLPTSEAVDTSDLNA